MNGQTRTTVNRMPSSDKKAFTLVELLVSLAIISILAGMAAQTMRVVLNARDLAMQRVEVNETARSTLEFMASEMRSAYLTPDSVKPVVTLSGNDEQVPRFRFAGIHRDVVATEEAGVPGAGEDDDQDGMIDEEVLDGINADFRGGAESSLRGSRPTTDPLGCEPGDPACIDEDIGLFPSDLLHFVSAIENSGDLILQEISYGLDPSGTKLVRRAQILELSGTGRANRQEILDFGQFIDNQSQKRLLPRPVPPGMQVPQAELQAAMRNWDTGAKYGQLDSETFVTNKNPGKLFQVLAYDIRGLRLRYWYYDYNRGGWRVTDEWDSSRETALVPPNWNLFNLPASNNSLEGNTRTGFANLIVNEPEDMYPKQPNNPLQFLVTNPAQLLSNDQYQQEAQRISQRTDGLPNMVEITIYVQDQKRNATSRPYSTRVFIPNNYRSIGA